ncbi:MAG: thiamine phosphate synthase [Sulfuricurvum sp.]
MQLYALCDAMLLASKGLSLEEFVDVARKHDAKVLQYRDKSGDEVAIKNALIKLRKLYDGFLIVNDHIDLVRFCDGVHLGQEDLLRLGADKKASIKALRSKVGRDKIIGLSTHNEAEILEANEMSLNYIGLGALRATTTKSDATNILGSRLDELASISTHPVAVIGGVRFDDSFEHVSYRVMGSGLFRED